VNCRSGCPTGGHSSWGECARAANISIGAVMTSEFKDAFQQTDRELKAYRNVRAEGIQPEGTNMEKINAAKNATKLLGRPYNAEVDPPAKFIQTKQAATFAKTGEI